MPEGGWIMLQRTAYDRFNNRSGNKLIKLRLLIIYLILFMAIASVTADMIIPIISKDPAPIICENGLIYIFDNPMTWLK